MPGADKTMREVVTIIATGLSIFGVGLGMLLAMWHPIIGVWLMAGGALYLLWELLTCAPLVRVVPEGMLRFLAGVMIAAFVVLIAGPDIERTLHLPEGAPQENTHPEKPRPGNAPAAPVVPPEAAKAEPPERSQQAKVIRRAEPLELRGKELCDAILDFAKEAEQEQPEIIDGPGVPEAAIEATVLNRRNFNARISTEFEKRFGGP